MKTVLVTGSSGAIGRAIAVECAKNGYNVICHYNSSQKKAEETLNLIKENGGQGELIQFDIADRADCKTKLVSLTEKYGPLWGIICNAGISSDNTFAALSADEWDSVVHTNLDSFFNVLNPLILPMASRKNKNGGRIITISSVSGIMGNRGQTNYSASKAGIIGASKALAVELASRKITVNCIAPGIIESEMTSTIDEQTKEKMIAYVPMGRMGKAEEVASLAAYLLSEKASYITRQVFAVDGGLS